uniref:DUF834 domain-containing protein n=1 Tax=Oryza glumipatula TaxID=40148 RepID=A0A0D9ZIB9_9ORYZ
MVAGMATAVAEFRGSGDGAASGGGRGELLQTAVADGGGDGDGGRDGDGGGVVHGSGDSTASGGGRIVRHWWPPSPDATLVASAGDDGARRTVGSGSSRSRSGASSVGVGWWHFGASVVDALVDRVSGVKTLLCSGASNGDALGHHSPS